MDAVLRLLIVEPKAAAKWKQPEEQDIKKAPVAIVDDSSPKPSSTKAFLGLCVNSRALTSMLIAFSVGIYMGGILDGALTLKVRDVSFAASILIRLAPADAVDK